MFTAEEMQKRIREAPFRPFRIIASEGLRYDIFHPDLVLVGHRDITIGQPWSKNNSIYSGLTRVALVHIVVIEDLPLPENPANVQKEAG